MSITDGIVSRFAGALVCAAMACAGFAQEASRSPAIVKPTVIDFPPPHTVSKAMGLKPGEGGTAQVQVCVDAKGTVTSAVTGESSGNPTLDAVGVALASKFRFKPGTVDGKRAAQCIPLAIRIPPLPEESPAAGPVRRQAQITYRPPPEYDSRGPVRGSVIGGSLRVKVCLDDTGKILDATIEEPSTDPQLNSLALRFARAHRFAPATVDGKPEPSCPILPVTFHPRAPAGELPRR